MKFELFIFQTIWDSWGYDHLPNLPDLGVSRFQAYYDTKGWVATLSNFETYYKLTRSKI